MKLRLWFGIFALLVSACGPTQQWVKPGATEADLQAAMTLCNRENVRFGRDNIMTFEGVDDEVIVTSRQKRYRRGAGEMMQEQCLESKGWRLEYVD